MLHLDFWTVLLFIIVYGGIDCWIIGKFFNATMLNTLDTLEGKQVDWGFEWASALVGPFVIVFVFIEILLLFGD